MLIEPELLTTGTQLATGLMSAVCVAVAAVTASVARAGSATANGSGCG